MAKSKEIDVDTEEYGKDDYQIDSIPKTYVLLNTFWDTIEEALPKHRTSLMRFIAKYRNKYIKRLETPYPIDYPPWIPACTKILYASTNINEERFIEAVMTIRGLDGYQDTYLKDKAGPILALMIARWFMMHDYKKELTIMEHYIGYSHYWAVFTKYFKKYKPNPQVMKYTINEMSMKSKLKQLGSVDLWLQDGVHNGLMTYKERLMRASDFELHYINEKISGKFNTAMKTIYRAQEKNEKDNKYIFTSVTNLENEEGEYSVDNTYGISEVITLSNSLTTKFFSNPISENAFKGALSPNGISKKDLRNAVIAISDDKKNIGEVKKFYQCLMYIYLEDGKNSAKNVGNGSFYIAMQKAYKPGNTNDPNRLYIKEFLDKWLRETSKTFRNTSRPATLTTFRKALYDYFVLKIMEDS